MQSSEGSEFAREQRRRRLIGGVAIAIIVVALTAAFVSFVRVDVCNDEVTQAGQVVEVCRRLEATDPPALGLALVVLAALGLGGFFSEVGFLGISLKRDLKDAKDAAESAKKAAESARIASERAAEVSQAANSIAADAKKAAESARIASERAADVSETANRIAAEAKASSSAASERATTAKGDAEQAVGSAASATKVARLAEELARQAPNPSLEVMTSEDVLVAIDELATEYNRVRREMTSGTPRTTQMTSIVSRLISLLHDKDNIDVSDLLGRDDRGWRLAGYSYLYARPQPERVRVWVLGRSRVRRSPESAVDARGLVGGVRLAVGVGGGDFEAVVLA